MKQAQDGRYAISEVGDLGLGLTPINEEEIDMDKEGSSKTMSERDRGYTLV